MKAVLDYAERVTERKAALSNQNKKNSLTIFPY